MKWLVLAVACIFAALLIYAEGDMPEYGNPSAIPNLHVSPVYIQKSLVETGTYDMVTAVLADYRGYDTLGETTVIFTAGLVCFMLLAKDRRCDQ